MPVLTVPAVTAMDLPRQVVTIIITLYNDNIRHLLYFYHTDITIRHFLEMTLGCFRAFARGAPVYLQYHYAAERIA